MTQALKGVARRAYEAGAYRFSAPVGDTSSKVAYTGTAGEITGLVDGALYRVWASTACHIRFAATGDADTGDLPLAASTAEYFILNGVTRVSAIQQSSGGNLYVTRMR